MRKFDIGCLNSNGIYALEKRIIPISAKAGNFLLLIPPDLKVRAIHNQ